MPNPIPAAPETTREAAQQISMLCPLRASAVRRNVGPAPEQAYAAFAMAAVRHGAGSRRSVVQAATEQAYAHSVQEVM